MINSKFLRAFHKLQLGITYKELFSYPFGSLCYSIETTDPSENHCLADRPLDPKEIKQVEERFLDLERTPSFYIEDTTAVSELVKQLKVAEYNQEWKDAWLFYNASGVKTVKDIDALVVSSEQELELFLHTFSLCFKEDDPQNPHGSMNERLENIRAVWNVHKGTGRLEYYLLFQNTEPVATSALTSNEGIGYIDSVGSLQKVRGQGFGKAATFFAVNESMKMGNSTHCLCTMEGTYPHEFYKRIGFEHVFSAIGYTRK